MVEDTTQKLAEERTRWAWDRTALSRERTFSAWMRTGLAAIGVGFIIAKLTEDTQPRWLATIIGSAFIIAGAVVQAVGFWEYQRLQRELGSESKRSVPLVVVAGLTVVVLLGAVGGVFLIIDG